MRRRAHAPENGGQKEIITSVHGRVLNAVTKQPLSRALVILHVPSMATFTDDRGQFELKIPEKINNVSSGGVMVALIPKDSERNLDCSTEIRTTSTEHFYCTA